MGLVSLGFSENHSHQGFFHSADNKIVQMAILTTIHFGYVLLQAFLNPSLKEGMNVAGNFIHIIKLKKRLRCLWGSGESRCFWIQGI